MHVDPSIDNKARRHFVALHEVTHDLLPWQRELGYVDDDMTLSDNVRRTFEREANQGAAEMFFQGARFAKMAADYEIGMGAVSACIEKTGASLRATMRRYAETHRHAVCAIALPSSPCQLDAAGLPRLEVSPSAAWAQRFGRRWPQLLDRRRLSVPAVHLRLASSAILSGPTLTIRAWHCHRRGHQDARRRRC